MRSELTFAFLVWMLAIPASWGAATDAVMQREVVQESDHFEFIYRAKLPLLERAAKLWIPLAGSNSFQAVQIEGISAPVEYRQVRDREYGNQIMILTAGPEQSGKTIEIKYRVRRREKTWYPSTEQDIKRHLKPERLVPVNETFKSIALEVAGVKSTVTGQGRALYQHVLSRMRYDKSGAGWGRGDAVYACDSGAGNCTDFHAYFIALARSIGIPARFAIGFTIPANVEEGVIAGYHCWAEFHADGKWVPVDISEASKHPELTDYYFGHHPANRFELSTGRDLLVEPPPVTSPINY